LFDEKEPVAILGDHHNACRLVDHAVDPRTPVGSQYLIFSQ
jgi:hypothetical protein